MYFEELYDQFLTSLSSSTLAELTDREVESELFNLAKRAIGAFKFPKIELTYEFDEDEEKHRFTNEVTQRELNVLITLMRLYWIEFLLGEEKRVENLYYDTNVRTFSMGNLLAQLNRMHENAAKAAKRAEYDYGRVNAFKKPSIGDIND